MLNRSVRLHFRHDFEGFARTVVAPYRPTTSHPRGTAPFMVLWAGHWRRVRIGGQNALFIGNWLALVQFA